MAQTSSRARPSICLGEGWRQFAFAQEHLQMLGTIQCGYEIGALARCGDGAYLQVNGDVQRKLQAKHVERAIRSAHPRSRRQPFQAARPRPMELQEAPYAMPPDGDGEQALGVPMLGMQQPATTERGPATPAAVTITRKQRRRIVRPETSPRVGQMLEMPPAMQPWSDVRKSVRPPSYGYRILPTREA